ncbi:YcaO-like family protein [Falsibacillus pallidus]|uniref:YcaO-like family protein n=1 Tax=Falsibacillus pallidus TaxID=493781 RepID=UPI003D981B7C
MYSWAQLGSSKLISSFHVNKSMFKESAYVTTIYNKKYPGVMGASIKNNLNSSLKAACGEHIERVALYNNPKYIKKRTIQAFNIINGDINEFPVETVLLSVDSIFQSKGMPDNFYNDSCGVASHLSSKEAINNSFLEFMERQSLIYNWLTCSPGKLVCLDECKNKEILKLLDKQYSFVDKVFIFEISIHPLCKVILVFGFGEKYFGMGLGADFHAEEAILKALTELEMCYSNSLNKYYVEKKDETSALEFNMSEEEMYKDPHFYANYFFRKYDAKKLKHVYAYLFDNVETVKIKEMWVDEPDQYDYMKKILYDLNLNIYGCYIPNANNFYKTKIFKVFSPDCYPHLNNKFYDAKDYKISYLNGEVVLRNNMEPVPFP